MSLTDSEKQLLRALVGRVEDLERLLSLHKKNSGIDHSYIDQGVTKTSAPTFKGIKLSEQSSLLSTPVSGYIEFANDRFYITNVGTQRAIDRTSDVLTSTVTVANTTTETTIFTGTLGANALKEGNIVKVYLSGGIANASASDDITIRKYIGTTLVEEFNPAMGNVGTVTPDDWHLENRLILRSVGASGSLAFHGNINIDGNEESVNSIESIDTTGANNITVTVQWDNASASNILTAQMGFMELKN